MRSTAELERIKEEVFEKISEYYAARGHEDFVPGKTRINYAKAIYDEKEVISVVDALFSGWFGLGPKGRELAEGLSEYLGVFKTSLVNSGSSANLLAMLSLKSKKNDDPIKAGEEVITPALTFPTTLNPILQAGLSPIFVDVNIETLNIDVEKLQEAISNKTRALMLPHTLGNPNDMDAIVEIASDHNLFIIEDNCDALGSEFNGKKTGSFGDISTCSFYPAHHITMGEGGSVSVVKENTTLARVVESLRDWGRDCWCASDEKSALGACNKRFEWVVGDVKYDHRYIYSHIGYNLKPTEMQAAVGLEQLKRLEQFISLRRTNFEFLHSHLKKYGEHLLFTHRHERANPAWFAFPITIREDAPFTREAMVKYIESKGILTRLVFAGDIRKHPAYKDYDFTSRGTMENTEYSLRNSFFIGVHPGLDEVKLQYILSTFISFFEGVKP